MKKSEIRVGGHYLAKMSGKMVTVRVNAIRDYCSPIFGKEGRWEKRYDVTNLSTGRKTTFRSAAKFRAEMKVEGNRFLEPVGYFGEEADPLRPTSVDSTSDH